MPASVQEAIANQATPQGAANKAGTEQISLFQEIVFTQYKKVVLPLDGYVFWVNCGLLNINPAVYNCGQFNEPVYNQDPKQGATPIEELVKGSLHYSTQASQEEDENIEINHVVFTAESEIQAFNQIAPTTMWIGSIDNIRFAFTSRTSFYRQAGLWHYIGDAIYPDMEPQIIDSVEQLNTQQQIVSNSLPLWLGLNNAQFNGASFQNAIPLYPSFLSPENLRPPFATVHVIPESTQAIAAAPTLDSSLSHYQLARERVRIVFWGCNNQLILSFVDFLNEYSLNFDTLGIMNIPTVRDEKRHQSELGTLAQKKSIEYEVSYYQAAARNIARELIKTVIVNYIINDN